MMGRQQSVGIRSSSQDEVISLVWATLAFKIILMVMGSIIFEPTSCLLMLAAYY